MFAAIATQGVREGVFMFLIGLTVFIATRNESKVGTYSLITSLVALFSFWAVGKWLKKKNRKLSMLIGVVMLGAVILLLFGELSYSRLLLFGVGTALFMPLYIVPMTSTVFDLIGQSEGGAEDREEYVVLRELGLTIGRMAGLSLYLIVLPFNDSPAAITWLLFAVGIAPIAGWLFIRPFLELKPAAAASTLRSGDKR